MWLRYVKCVVGDFTLASAAPLHAMQLEGVVDRNVKFTPVLDGFRMPEYIDWELQPFSNHKVPLLLLSVFSLEQQLRAASGYRGSCCDA